MDDLRVEVGVAENFKKKLVRSRLKWIENVERMGYEKLTKRADVLKMERRQKRSTVRWEDCVRIVLERLGGEWRTLAKYRGSLRLMVEKAMRER